MSKLSRKNKIAKLRGLIHKDVDSYGALAHLNKVDIDCIDETSKIHHELVSKLLDLNARPLSLNTSDDELVNVFVSNLKRTRKEAKQK